MEPVGLYRISEKCAQMKKMQFYGEGDSKSFDAVKNVYGENIVNKFECIAHIQKRVDSRLRKLKQKGLGGRGKLTDSFIDKLPNYYGIAIISNISNIEKMQSAVIATFFSLLFQQKPTVAWLLSSWTRQLVEISTSYI
ncbi:uncharacterized protein TNCV_4112211 [Trichonephila clavipes]|nr:uncharacterized protein TNCV_4112211 [Trichonephila clavipes]